MSVVHFYYFLQLKIIWAIKLKPKFIFPPERLCIWQSNSRSRSPNLAGRNDRYCEGQKACPLWGGVFKAGAWQASRRLLGNPSKPSFSVSAAGQSRRLRRAVPRSRQQRLHPKSSRLRRWRSLRTEGGEFLFGNQ